MFNHCSVDEPLGIPMDVGRLVKSGLSRPILLFTSPRLQSLLNWTLDRDVLKVRHIGIMSWFRELTGFEVHVIHNSSLFIIEHCPSTILLRQGTACHDMHHELFIHIFCLSFFLSSLSPLFVSSLFVFLSVFPWNPWKPLHFCRF